MFLRLYPLITALAVPLATAAPDGFVQSRYSEDDMTPSPACLSAAPNGDLYVGVDLNGSLGKAPEKGRVVKLLDKFGNGRVDDFTVFAEIDNPRGLFAVGNKLFALHSVIPKDTGVLSELNLSVLVDQNGDGVADGPPKTLVRNLSTPKSNQKRGADHTTNGIRMGIDGWIYIAVGDFGFVDAVGSDGRKLTQLGGGILRVRPDGAEMEVYTQGLRNTYDVAIDPFMNIYTRGNTNDGGGWNVRFIHHVQSGNYGYPRHYINFSEEILPALVDLGGGSGVGALFLDEPTWPEEYNKVPLTGDWGKSQLYLHRLTEDGPSFKQEEEEFARCSQITDVDVDASGRMYLAAWNGAGYKGSPKKGFVDIVKPDGWRPVRFPNLPRAELDALVGMVGSTSSTVRLHAQQELLRRKAKDAMPGLLEMAGDSSKHAEARVAAIFTYAQLGEVAAIPGLVELSEDASVREFALRALADRKPFAKEVPLEPFLAGLKDSDPRVQVAAAVGLGRLGKKEAAEALLAVSNPIPSQKGMPHAEPNSGVILPHVAVRALIALDAQEACLKALNSPNRYGALWALRWMHSAKVVDGLMSALETAADADFQKAILATLARLYQREAPYDGSWWWGTRPDTRGPYYKPEKWEKSGAIESMFRAIDGAAQAEGKAYLAQAATRNRMNLKGIGKVEVETKVDTDKKGEVGRTSIEDIILALDDRKGDPKKGAVVITQLSCIGCHNLKPGELIKGPDLAALGGQTREQIAESVLKPAAIISESWVNVTMKDGTIHSGTLVSKDAEKVVIHNIAGIPTTVNAAEIGTIATQEFSVMAPGLADELSIDEFVDMVEYLKTME